jgi:hypothetical protein
LLKHVLRSIVIFHSSLYDGGFGTKIIIDGKQNFYLGGPRSC